MRIKGHDVGELLKRTWREIGDDRMTVYAAQMAYAFFFSLFPLLLFFAALLGLVSDKATVQQWLTGRVANALPGDVASLVATTVNAVIFADGAPGILSFGLITAAWSGSGVFGALRGALNAAYDVTEARAKWKQYAVQLTMLLVSGVVILVASVVLLNGEAVMGWIGDRLGLSRATTMVWSILQFPLAIAAIIGLFYIIYMYLPNTRRQKKSIVLFGAVLATTLWILATLLFRIYVQRFNRLNPAYGSIGAIMILLTWMYYSSFVLLAVGELNAEMEHDPSDARPGIPRERMAARTTTATRAASPGATRRPPEHVAASGMTGRLVRALGMAAIAGFAARLLDRTRDDDRA